MILVTSLCFLSGPELLFDTWMGQNFCRAQKGCLCLSLIPYPQIVLVTYFSNGMTA